jgi:lipid A 4'-phosphatase
MKLPGLTRMLRKQGARARELRLWACALALACAVFGLWPGVDIPIETFFYRPGSGFQGKQVVWVMLLYRSVVWIARIVALLLAVRLLLARWPAFRLPAGTARRAAALLFALVIGSGALVNGVFKDHWGRPRPYEVTVFGGTLPFVPALQPSKLCARNCSFVSGHAASGFALIAVGVFAAPARRRYWLGVGLGVGSMIGLGRMLQGSHYASDVVFSALAMWACVLLLRAAWLRLRALALRRRRSSALAQGEAGLEGGSHRPSVSSRAS